MGAPRINLALLSASTRANLEKALGNSVSSATSSVLSPSKATEGVATEEKLSKKPISRKKKTLTPDMAEGLVKSVKVSEDGNEVKIVLAVAPDSLSTAQQKGAFVGKDGRVHFFTKSKIAKAAKALSIALSPYAHLSGDWGEVPIELTFDAYFAYPSGTPAKYRYKIGPHTSRPDGDNLLKLPADVMTDVGFWKDDSKIGTYIIRKRRTTGPACIVIKIKNLQPQFEALYAETEEFVAPTLFNEGKGAKTPFETNPLEDLQLQH